MTSLSATWHRTALARRKHKQSYNLRHDGPYSFKIRVKRKKIFPLSSCFFVSRMVMVMRRVSKKSSSEQKTSAPCKTITEVVSFPPHPPQPKQGCRHQGSTWYMHAFSLDTSRFLLPFTHSLLSGWGLGSQRWLLWYYTTYSSHRVLLLWTDTMTKATLIRTIFNWWWVYRFRGSVHYYQGRSMAASRQAFMVQEKLRVLHLHLNADGRVVTSIQLSVL